MTGKLLIVATPLGNLGDMSPRAVAALKGCDLILAEDTRHSKKLLNQFGIETKVESFHDHNEDEKTSLVIARIEAGDTIAIISDAGTPVISDPGFPLIRKARVQGILIEPVPGPFAGVVALVASGLPPSPFSFFGFPPHRTGERLDFYRTLGSHGMTAIVYESPQRLMGSLEDLRKAIGDVEITVAREMTKMHEEFLHGRISEVLAKLEGRDTIRGEVTIVIGAAEKERPLLDVEKVRHEFQRLRDDGLKRNDAVRILADRYGVGKNELYKKLLEA